MSKTMTWKMIVPLCYFPYMIFLFLIMIAQHYHNQELIFLCWKMVHEFFHFGFGVVAVSHPSTNRAQHGLTSVI